MGLAGKLVDGAKGKTRGRKKASRKDKTEKVE